MIYFIQTADNQFVKIGVTEDPIRRMAGLQTSTPYTLKLLAVMPGGREEESAIHLRFRRYAVRGEWFRTAFDVARYAAEHGIRTTAYRHSENRRARCFADLVPKEPRLLDLYATAASTCDDGRKPSFCANSVWYGNFGWPGIKPELTYLVGWSAENTALRSRDAYEAAYHTIYETLPGCRNCLCE